MYSRGYNPGGTRKKLLDIEDDLLRCLKLITLTGKPTPTTAGTKGDVGLWTDGYIYIWLTASVVIRFPVEESW
jgi:hypothetical protein